MPVDDAATTAAAAQRTALDPTTDPQVLAAIAQDRPDLRPAVAMNPTTYPALLEWLANLDDPVINAALTTRTTRASTPTATPGPAPVPVSPPTPPVAPSPALTSVPELAPVAGSRPDTMTEVTPPRAQPKRRRGVLVSVALGVIALSAGGVLAFQQITDNPRPAAAEISDTVTDEPQPTTKASEPPAEASRGAATVVTNTITVGNSPAGITVDSDAHTLYVANMNDSSVSMVDTVTGQVTDTINVGFKPFLIAVDPDAHTVYLTNSDDGLQAGPATAAVDLITGQVTDMPEGAEVQLSMHAWLTWSDQGRGYDYNTNNDADTVTARRDGEVVDTIAVGDTPYGLGVDPEAGAIYVANVGDDTVSIIDRATHEVTHTIAVGSKPIGIAVDRATGTVYVTHMGANTVSVLQAP